MTLALSDSQLTLVRSVLAQHLPGREVLAFGSRAHRRGLKPWSDLDLAVLGDPPPDQRQMACAAEAFDDSDLPMRVDLVAWAEAPRWLRELIEADGVTLQTRLQRA